MSIRQSRSAAQVQPVFVSIDPQRDTPEALREYLQNFDARILPLSRDAEQLARAAGSLGVVFYKVPGPTPDAFAHKRDCECRMVPQRTRVSKADSCHFGLYMNAHTGDR